MQRLPVELRAYVVEIICQDDDILAASAGVRSLLRLNRCWNDTVSPFIYHTIIADTPSKICAVYARLNAAPNNARRVHRLVISDEPQAEWSSERRGKAFPTENMDERKVINGLLDLCRRTLRSLSLTVMDPLYGTNLLGNLWRICFPVLITLEIKGLYPHPALPDNFPSLRTLRLEAWSNTYDLFYSGALDMAFPALEHLTFAFNRMIPSKAFALALDYSLHSKADGNFTHSCWFPYDRTIRTPKKLGSIVVDMRNRSWKTDCKRFRESRPILLSLQDKKSTNVIIEVAVLE